MWFSDHRETLHGLEYSGPHQLHLETVAIQCRFLRETGYYVDVCWPDCWHAFVHRVPSPPWTGVVAPMRELVDYASGASAREAIARAVWRALQKDGRTTVPYNEFIAAENARFEEA